MSNDSWRRVFRTFIVAFVGIAVPASLQFLHDVTSWASTDGQAGFPDWHHTGFIFVAAVCAGLIAAVNAALVFFEDKTGRTLFR